jgi:Flp pilus assembly CpaE family ATPase
MMPAAVEIPYDERAALTAANRGVPLIMRDRDRPISKSLLQLAEIIYDRLSSPQESEVEAEDAEAEDVGGTGLLRLRKALSRG